MTPDLSPSLAAAAVGTADTAAFLIARPRLFRERPGRAAGSAAALLAWVTVGTRAAFAESRGDAWTRGLCAALLASNVAVLAVHLRHGIAGPRVYVGTVAAAVALAGTFRP
ncbi:MAG: hypothetical protein JOZ46_01900 [Candidatus Dormibacteraeota bacterium]|nr:hypothetical protein [Candidatus Dormibacteraeota bacterium]MBV9524549.1 hypothetical protein [Candidatus Dormibacteraeota bacterium]